VTEQDEKFYENFDYCSQEGNSITACCTVRLFVAAHPAPVAGWVAGLQEELVNALISIEAYENRKKSVKAGYAAALGREALSGLLTSRVSVWLQHGRQGRRRYFRLLLNTMMANPLMFFCCLNKPRVDFSVAPRSSRIAVESSCIRTVPRLHSWF
jgi:hypothetical protein